MHIYRTHTCGALRATDVGAEVKLSGWIHRKRDHGGLLFIDLRDHYGLTQCVVLPTDSVFRALESVRLESVVTVSGDVVARDEATANPNLATGAVELRVRDAKILSEAAELPLPVAGEPDYPEDIRLTHRYLDLRRPTLHRNIAFRSEFMAAIRRRMIAAGFTEYQTPILTASSPEGARDFLVPSRLHPGKFYALPQAPQIFKQLIMMAGFDRYFQIAPCFRDEDARADRSPGEFYQLDVEMSFVTQNDVLGTMEPVVNGLFTEFADGRSINPSPFPRITYNDAMLQYGSDKPDLRISFVCSDVSAFFVDPSVEFRAFRKVVEDGGVVRAIPAPGAATQPRSFFDRLNDWARTEMAAPGLGYVTLEAGDGGIVAKGPIGRFLPAEIVRRMAAHAGVGAGDALFFAAGKEREARMLAGAARGRIGRELGKVEDKAFRFCWVVDYPMYEWDDETKQVIFSHNPFSMPQGGLAALESGKPLDVHAYQYDLVCNGIELCSGAIRNHLPDIMVKAFEIAGYTKADVEKRFGGMLSAFRYGAPPHGGLALGLDRIVMLLAGTENIRDVVMFPMNQRGQDLMLNAPSDVSAKQLRELHIRLADSAKS